MRDDEYTKCTYQIEQVFFYLRINTHTMVCYFYEKNVTRQLPINTMEIRIVPIWSVLADPRRSIGACRVLDTATLRPPSRTWRRIRAISITADVRVIICIIFLRTTGVYQKVFFLQFFLHLDGECGNITDMKTKYLL